MTTILNEFVNQTSFLGVVQTMNTEVNGYIGVFILAVIFAISMIFSLRTLDSERALLVTFLGNLIFALALYYMNLLNVWWVYIMLIGLIGTALYSHFGGE